MNSHAAVYSVLLIFSRMTLSFEPKTNLIPAASIYTTNDQFKIKQNHRSHKLQRIRIYAVSNERSGFNLSRIKRKTVPTVAVGSPL